MYDITESIANTPKYYRLERTAPMCRAATNRLAFSSKGTKLKLRDMAAFIQRGIETVGLIIFVITYSIVWCFASEHRR